MNNAHVISIVSNLLKEKDYYEASFKECRAIIKQLTEGPGDIEYIHPFDFCEMLNDLTPTNSIIDLWKIDNPESFEVTSTGKKYKRSVFIPAKSKKFK